MASSSGSEMRSSIAVLVLSILMELHRPACAAAPVMPAPPSFDANSYLVMDFQSGRMLVQERIDERVEPASLTKIMTVYVVGSEIAAGNTRLDDMVTVSERAWRMSGSKMFIRVDEQVSVADLLKGVVIQSGNDASVALAEHVAGSEEVFAAMMNEHASRLGLTGTNYANSTGWPDPNHYTTARDLAALTAALIRDFPDLYAWHSIKEFTYNGIKQHNRNELLGRDPSVDGVKTGHTESAGYCLVGSARRDDMRIITVVMGADGPNSRSRATETLLNFAFRFYETHKLYGAGETITTSRVWKGAAESLGLGIEEDLYVSVPRGMYERLDKAAEVKETIIAPVNEGEVRGTLTVRLAGEELASRPLITLDSVAPGSLFSRLRDDVRLFFQ